MQKSAPINTFSSSPSFFLENQPGDSGAVIYDRGCLRAGEEWVERNLVPVAGVTVAMAVLQVEIFRLLCLLCMVRDDLCLSLYVVVFGYIFTLC
jgi:hypothetical protein